MREKGKEMEGWSRESDSGTVSVLVSLRRGAKAAMAVIVYLPSQGETARRIENERARGDEYLHPDLDLWSELGQMMMAEKLNSMVARHDRT